MKRIIEIARFIGKVILSIICFSTGTLSILLCMGRSPYQFLGTLLALIFFASIGLFCYSLLVLIWDGKDSWMTFFKKPKLCS